MNGGATRGTFDVSILEVELENMWALVESPAAQQDLLKWAIPNSSSALQQGVKKGGTTQVCWQLFFQSRRYSRSKEVNGDNGRVRSGQQNQ
ncbi:hypothetical protein F0562_017947 [Nyssa sinensis]|uniref:Uncharacterized protein n=1 Tax=Nyssa sinensis TaxID=561372 RepID=A0A5J4ZB24_9ASTE|nr:hypothetical protein F0562_017947 [Nyssa sinensis]